MKILFTLLSIESKNNNYLLSAKELIKEILLQTKHDILLSTNNVEFFSDINDERIIIRNNIDDTSKFQYNGEFNYNLKYHAFKNIPPQYDYIIYLDCDIKLENWTTDSDSYFLNTISKYDFAATRLNCVLSDEIGYYLNNQNCLFKHKIVLYNILEKYKNDDDILKSQLPSEHFFILKNDTEKINMFQQKWKEQNDELQKTGCSSCSWGDGFEIGISARFAGLNNTFEVNFWEWCYLLGFKFNGNKI
jgi:hypothetical protein